MPGNAALDYWNQVLNGRNPFGTFGPINFSPSNAFNGVDNSHSNPYGFTWNQPSEGGGNWNPDSTLDPRMSLHGNTVVIDGNYVPIGGMSAEEFSSNIIDPSQLRYDPTYGLEIPDSDIRSEMRTSDGDLTFALGLLGMGAVAAPYLAAVAGGEGGIGAGTAGAFNESAGLIGADGTIGGAPGGAATASGGVPGGGSVTTDGGGTPGGAPGGGTPGGGAPGGTGTGTTGGGTDWMGIARSIPGLISGISGIANNRGGTGNSAYVPQWQGGADQMWQNLMRSAGGAYNSQLSTLLPYLMSAFTAGAGEVPGVQGRMRDVANEDVTQAHQLFSNAGDLRNAGRQLWTTAQDPEGALRARLYQQTQDASRAATSSRGIGMSPQAAGMETDALSNFGMNWEDRQLGRQVQGLQGYSGASRDAGMLTQAGVNDLGSAVGMNIGALGLPFDFAGSFSGAMQNGIYNPMFGMGNQLSNYLYAGRAGGQQNFDQGQVNLNNLTTGLNQFGNSGGWGALTRFFGGAGSGGGSNGGVDIGNWDNWGTGQ